MTTNELQGKTALVTGAGQGVGQGIALALAGAGVQVVVAGRTLQKVEATRDQIIERGGQALAVSCDVKLAESLQQLVQSTVDAYGGLQILVNNAHEVPLGTLDEITEEQLAAGWESGPLATLRLMKLCRPYLKGDGCIVNLASAAGKRWDMTGYGAYAATKEAIRSLTRAAACEWGPEGIRSNVILPLARSPGFDWWEANRPEEAAAFVKDIPQRRVGDCETDIGAFVLTLCSQASAFVNGQSIGLDGGQALIG